MAKLKVIFVGDDGDVEILFERSVVDPKPENSCKNCGTPIIHLDGRWLHKKTPGYSTWETCRLKAEPRG